MDRTGRDDRAALRGDRAAALRAFMERATSGGFSDAPSFRDNEQRVNVPKIGEVLFMPQGAGEIFVDGTPTRDRPFTMFGVPLRLDYARYHLYPEAPELGWTALNDTGLKEWIRFRDGVPGAMEPSDWYYDSGVSVRRADAFHADASAAATKRVRAILDEAVNGWAKSFRSSIAVGERIRLLDDARRLHEQVEKKRNELDELESKAADLMIRLLRHEAHGAGE